MDKEENELPGDIVMHDLSEDEIIRLRAKNYGISYSKAKEQIKMMRQEAENEQELINIIENISSWYRRIRRWFN